MAAKGIERGLTNYGDAGFSRFLRGAFMRQMGYDEQDLAKPIIGIFNTYSELNPCHRGFKELAPAVRRGVTQAGGLPVELPTISLGETFLNPTSMLFRNLMAMDTEEMIRAHPLDAVVLMGGCDKTPPAQLMGAASAGVPAVYLVAGPMLTGDFEGQRLGACTDCRRLWGDYRAGRIDERELDGVQGQLMPTAGTCMVMGTASTMACMIEALGMMVPGGASAPAAFSDRLRCGVETGRVAVALAEKEIAPERIMTPQAFENAIRVLLAIGGSTNGVVHLTAMAGRLGIEIEQGIFDRLSEDTPMIVNLLPSGEHYMEDFHKAGGMRVVLHALKDKLHLDCLTVTGQTLGERLQEEFTHPAWQNVILPASAPLQEKGGLVVLRGNLCPDGAVLKRSAASPDLMSHKARAVVFDNLEDLALRIDADDLDVRAEDILVLRNAGPIGAPGMPESGYIPIPKKLAREGVKDMVRISDARMSGTAFGTIVLHISPEAALGGNLALVHSGDMIELNVPERRLELLVDEATLETRRQAWSKPEDTTARGYLRLHLEQVQQAHLGCDLAFLRPPLRHKLA
ncbi:MAG: dihydroxy-acid dehydratase [SAR324 cluster bacterium]|nr:dihydroxy-acid dehydratase [SAR324 cluster bacterium]